MKIGGVLFEKIVETLPRDLFSELQHIVFTSDKKVYLGNAIFDLDGIRYIIPYIRKSMHNGFCEKGFR